MEPITYYFDNHIDKVLQASVVNYATEGDVTFLCSDGSLKAFKKVLVATFSCFSILDESQYQNFECVISFMDKPIILINHFLELIHLGKTTISENQSIFEEFVRYLHGGELLPESSSGSQQAESGSKEIMQGLNTLKLDKFFSYLEKIELSELMSLGKTRLDENRANMKISRNRSSPYYFFKHGVLGYYSRVPSWDLKRGEIERRFYKFWCNIPKEVKEPFVRHVHKVVHSYYEEERRSLE